MDENGIISPRCKFPMRYGPMGLIGTGCTQAIGPSEAFCYIPTKVIIRSDLVKDSDIGFILEEFKENIGRL